MPSTKAIGNAIAKYLELGHIDAETMAYYFQEKTGAQRKRTTPIFATSVEAAKKKLRRPSPENAKVYAVRKAKAGEGKDGQWSRKRPDGEEPGKTKYKQQGLGPKPKSDAKCSSPNDKDSIGRKCGGRASLKDLVEPFLPYAKKIIGDETGAEAEKAVEKVLSGVDDDDFADAIFEQWDEVLTHLKRAAKRKK